MRFIYIAFLLILTHKSYTQIRPDQIYYINGIDSIDKYIESKSNIGNHLKSSSGYILVVRNGNVAASKTIYKK